MLWNWHAIKASPIADLYTYQSQHALAFLDCTTAAKEANQEDKGTNTNEHIGNHVQGVLVLDHSEQVHIGRQVRVQSDPDSNG